jgi:tRNA nucleotidyltransferase (CCA-adding enzyme)
VTVKEVLTRIEENGFEAYVVGGFVRDFLLGIESTDVDICTNARVKDLLDVFKDVNATSNEYGSVKILTNDLRIDITTYRKDVKYNGDRRSVEIEYVNNLMEDINRRDFTMNTICMNKEGSILDILNGQEDIKNKIIRCVGVIDDRLKEDPLRMLRAVRFATTLDFKIEEELYKAMKANRKLLENLSRERVKEELTKILVCENAVKGLDMLKNLGYLPYLGIDYNSNIVNVNDICGMYSQIEIIKDLPFSKEERENIKKVKSILKYGTIDDNVVFTYGLYLSMVAGSILGIDKEEVTRIEKNLVIKRYKDIDFTTDDLCKLYNIKPSKILSEVFEELKMMILSRELENNKEAITKYLIANQGKWLNEGANI